MQIIIDLGKLADYQDWLKLFGVGLIIIFLSYLLYQFLKNLWLTNQVLTQEIKLNQQRLTKKLRLKAANLARLPAEVADEN
jgi:hypothetical protein